jgi:hypothetical protein
MARWPLVLPFVTLLASSPAWALQPAKHRALAEAACADAGLATAFCSRMGKAAFETDYKEWDDLSAHAQRELGEDRCSAADAAVARVDHLAHDAVASTRAGDLEAGAIALGRAIHTLQDECAHHGMTNQEHAFYSLEQVCTSEDTSPDVQPEALACAESRTRQAFALVAPALANTRWDAVDWICRDSEDRDTCATASLPGPWTACSFLAEHKEWDGVDSRWNADRVGSALMSAFAAGLAGDLSPRSVCGGDASAIDPTAPHATVTDRNAGCGLIDITCLGKVDEDSGAAMSESGGCAAGHSGGAAGALLVSLIAAGLLRRRSAQ